ncbi:RDD family protein [Nitrincola alkalilacustris]|uniref:RDD family protein n=1 Tax=Nitrincola alkalilacustris TaxID=1571224 RepID=UPI00124C92C3|nr:RDD family protein [Nitrincola alkalilacustris]
MSRPYNDEIRTSPAGLGRRLMAMFYDLLLILSIWMIIGFIAVAINDGEAVEGPIMKATLFSATFLFFGFFWTRNGQTLGMQAWRLRVQTMDGRRLSWWKALLRYMLAIPSLLVFGLGYFWMLFGDERLTWHDRLSDTCVVLLPKLERK